MKKNIAVLPGDGIGPEIIAQAVAVLDAVAERYGHEFNYEYAQIGACAIDACGDPYPQETHEICMRADAILFGSIGDPKYDNDPAAKVRPEQGLLRMRKSLGLYANIRPVKPYDSLLDASPLKNERVAGSDFIVVRELTGGIYFGEPRGRDASGNTAFDNCVYSREEIERVAHVAFQYALRRRGKVTLVGCPKLDGVDYSEKLAQIIRNNDIQSVTVVRMEVPCCGGLEFAVKKALQQSGKFIPWQVVTVGINGSICD